MSALQRCQLSWSSLVAVAAAALGLAPLGACGPERYFFVCGKGDHWYTDREKAERTPGPKWECHADACPVGRYPKFETSDESSCKWSANYEGGNYHTPPMPIAADGNASAQPFHHDRDGDGVGYPEDLDDDDPNEGRSKAPGGGTSSSSTSSGGTSTSGGTACDQAWTCDDDAQASSYCQAACAYSGNQRTQTCEVLKQTFPTSLKCCPICSSP